MKFVISLVLLSGMATAAPIQLFYEEEPSKAQLVKGIFMSEYEIPEELIALRKTHNCDELKNRGKLDLCLKNNGDLIVVSVDKIFVSESLKIFNAP